MSFKHSAERAALIDDLSRDFAFADVIARLHRAANEMPPDFCGREMTRVWLAVEANKLDWFERAIVTGRIDLIT
jgi:hypothetical protein